MLGGWAVAGKTDLKKRQEGILWHDGTVLCLHYGSSHTASRRPAVVKFYVDSAHLYCPGVQSNTNLGAL